MSSRKDPTSLRLPSVREVVSTIASGVRFWDKVVLSIHYFLRLLERIAIKPFDYRAYAMLCRLPSDVLISRDGVLFRARKGTNDVFHLTSWYEPEVEKIIKSMPLEGKVFIDVGAHIGRYSLMVASRSPNTTVLAFEPNPEVYDALVYNIRLNGLQNVVALPYALGDQNGTVVLDIDPSNTGGSSIVVSRGGRKVTVPLRTLDSVLDELGIPPSRVGLMKVDVEGAEALVFKGSERLLQEGAPTIIFEAWNEQNLKKCEQVLSKFRYRIERIDKRNYLATKEGTT